MTRLTIRVDLVNASLAGDDDYGTALADIVQDIAACIRNYGTGGVVHDVNGNRVGRWSIR
jgi:hypothetical protein